MAKNKDLFLTRNEGQIKVNIIEHRIFGYIRVCKEKKFSSINSILLWVHSRNVGKKFYNDKISFRIIEFMFSNKPVPRLLPEAFP